MLLENTSCKKSTLLTFNQLLNPMRTFVLMVRCCDKGYNVKYTSKEIKKILRFDIDSQGDAECFFQVSSGLTDVDKRNLPHKAILWQKVMLLCQAYD